MKAIPLTRAAALALRAKLRTALGYPRAAVEADRRGGGIHVPLELAGTTEAVEYDEGAGEVLVPVELEARLSATERSKLRAPTVRVAPAVEPARVEVLADEPSAPSTR